jgi:hypothetical protein
VGGDDLLEREVTAPDGRHQPVEEGRYLHPGETKFLTGRITDEDGQVERQVGDVRERMSGVDGQRREDREDLVVEEPAQVLALVVVEVLPTAQRDGRFGQRGAEDGRETGCLPGHQGPGLPADRSQFLHRTGTLGGGRTQTGRHPGGETGDPDHEEFVEVPGKDGGVFHPLQQRDRRVVGHGQHPGVEVQP